MDDGLLYAMAITALVVSDILLVALGVLLHRLRRRPAERDPDPDADPQALRQDLKALAVSLGVLGERLARIEGEVARLRDQGEQRPQPASKESDRKAFEVATKLALRGADAEELVDLCGLTRGEAELIRRLHAGREAGVR